MLASTVQFSTYDQTPTRLHRLTRTSPQGQRRYDRRSAPTQEQRPHPVPRAVRSLRTQQRAYDPVLRAIRVPHATEVTPYWDRPRPAAELVSVPPSSTTPDARGPSRLTGRRDLGAALDHHNVCGGQCSLERR